MVKKAKVIFLGDSAVGKSCIISCINEVPISHNHEPTIGLDFSTRSFQRAGEEYKLQLWDTAGQEKFRSIMPSYIRNSKVAILVYDVTCIKSFLNLDKWIDMFHQAAAPTSRLLLVGNKIDLEDSRRVSIEKIESKINQYKLRYVEISAKTREGVKDMVELILSELEKMEIQNESDGKKLDSKMEPTKKTCCFTS